MRKFKNLSIGRYIFVGGISAVCDMSLFYLFNEIYRLDLIKSVMAAFSIATIVNYILCIEIIFKTARKLKNKIQEIAAILTVSLLGMCFNIALIYVMVEVFGIDGMTSKIIAIIMVFTWNYMARRKIVFTELKSGVN